MNLFIRNFPNETHRELKAMAARKNVPLYELIVEILRSFVNAKNNSKTKTNN